MINASFTDQCSYFWITWEVEVLLSHKKHDINKGYTVWYIINNSEAVWYIINNSEIKSLQYSPLHIV
jgi:hypothetical protein